MYAILYRDKGLDKRYRETGIPLILKDPQKYSVHISDDVRDSDKRIHHAWDVPAVSDPLCFINDHQYLEDVSAPQAF